MSVHQSEPLRGLACSATEFIPTAEALNAYRVVLVDQRGHGRSTRVPIDTSHAAFVADVVRVIEKECCGPVALVGRAMGAHTAMLTAASRPDLVERLVLLEEAGSLAENAEMGDYFRSWPAPFADRAAAREYLGSRFLEQAWVDDLKERADGLYARFEADVMVRTINAVSVPQWDAWESVSVPTLVIYASQGMFSEENKAAFVRRGQNVERADIQGAAHDAHLDSFAEWIKMLGSFLSRPTSG